MGDNGLNIFFSSLKKLIRLAIVYFDKFIEDIEVSGINFEKT